MRTLSEKWRRRVDGTVPKNCYDEEDVKEFIRLLKEEFNYHIGMWINITEEQISEQVKFTINKLAGAKLI